MKTDAATDKKEHGQEMILELKHADGKLTGATLKFGDKAVGDKKKYLLNLVRVIFIKEFLKTLTEILLLAQRILMIMTEAFLARQEWMKKLEVVIMETCKLRTFLRLQ